MFDVFINCFESLCIFLMVSLLTWRLINGEILESKYFKQIFILTGLLFMILSNVIQICSFVVLPTALNKTIGLILFTITLSTLCSGFFSKFKHMQNYILSILVSLVSIFLADAIVLITYSIIYKDIFSIYNYYKVACCVSLIIKYIILIIMIKIKEPNFFKFTKDKGVTLLASTVTLTAKSGRWTPSWLFFYQAKAPKCLDNLSKKDNYSK